MTVGAALTVKTLVPVPTPASGLVTVTLRAPVVAARYDGDVSGERGRISECRRIDGDPGAREGDRCSRDEPGAGDRDGLAGGALTTRRWRRRGDRRGGVDREDAGPGAHPGVGVGDGDVASSGCGRPDAMVMLAVSEVALTKVVELQ